MNDRKKKIAIICEGFEEKPYLDKLFSFPCFKRDKYDIDLIINVKGNGRIFPRFQDLFNKDKYDLILIFCDADNNSKQFQSIIDKINNEIFAGHNIAQEILIFVNPVTLQVVLSHFDKVDLTHVAKNKNHEIVESLTGIKCYNATQEQIKQMMDLITYRSYETMKNNLKEISTDMTCSPSTNLLLFLERFENDDTSWIDDIVIKMNNAK